jgi:TonB-linked SusC/RagA family outer membrane protein
MLCSILALAQTRVVTGRITDEGGAAVTGATISIRGSSTATSADENGNFRINAKAGDVLVVSATNYASKEMTVGTASNYSIAISRQSALIDEVVVTALGIRRQAKELGYATATLRSDDITQGRAVNLQQGLTGKVSGLNITTTNNSVFEDVRINLRGLRSLTGNNQPMLVIDGIPTPLSYMSSLNPNDVADVNILKGASAAALYGPDGVNGVIIVNTRKGTRGAPVVTLSSTYQINRVSYLPKRQNEYGNGAGTDAFGRPLYDPLENFSYGDRFDGSVRPIGRVLEDGTIQEVPYAALKEDHQKKFWNEHGATFQNDLSFSTQDFYMSVQNADIKGLIPGDVRTRRSFRFNAGKTYNKFSANFNINYINTNFNVMDQAGYASRLPAYNGSIYSLVLQTARNIPLTSYKDWRNDKFSQFSNYYNEYATNPYWSIANHRSTGRTDNLLGAMVLKYDLGTWLQATARLGTNLAINSYKNTAAPIVVSDYAHALRSGVTYTSRPGQVQDGSSQSSRVNAEFFVNGRQNVSDFGITYLAGTQWRQNDSKEINNQGSNLVVPELYNLANRTGEITAPTGMFLEYNVKNRLVSAFGTLGFSYKNWANVEFTARNDWDSRLHPENNSYFYPAVSASLILSDAISALKNTSWLSYFKLRGAISKTGNVNLLTYALDPTYSSAGGFPYGTLPAYTADNSVPDPDLRPEFVKSKEIGVELGFLKSRINLDATYFHQRNTDQILSIQTSFATGFGSKLANTADFTNQGVELDLRLTPLFNIGAGRFDLRLNATWNDNKIIRLSSDVNELSIGGSANFTQLKAGAPNAFNYAIVGMPAFVFKLTDYKRDPLGRVIVDATTGNPQLSDSLVTMGRTLPTWVVGINPSFGWKGLSIGMTIDYKGGHHAYHGIGNDMDGYGISARSAQYGRQRFVFPNSVIFDGAKYVENTNKTVQGAGYDFWQNQALNTQIATNYFTSAAAWKLRELQIAYELPSRILGSQKIIKGATISLVGRNLITLLPESNQWSDPEFNYNTSGVPGAAQNTNAGAQQNTSGVSSVFQTPPVRTFGASVVLTF